MMRFTFDTSILLYAADAQSGPRHQIAHNLVGVARDRDCVVTLQSLAELFRVLTAKKKLSALSATGIIQAWRDAVPVVVADEHCLVDAMDAVAAHGLSFWDAMIWATAKRAGCRLLITEDGQDGRSLGGVTFVNPFSGVPSPLLAHALGH